MSLEMISGNVLNTLIVLLFKVVGWRWGFYFGNFYFYFCVQYLWVCAWFSGVISMLWWFKLPSACSYFAFWHKISIMFPSSRVLVDLCIVFCVIISFPYSIECACIVFHFCKLSATRLVTITFC